MGDCVFAVASKTNNRCPPASRWGHLFIHLVQPPIPPIRYFESQGEVMIFVDSPNCSNLRAHFLSLSFFLSPLLGNSVFLILPLPKIVKFPKNSTCECQLGNFPEVPQFLAVAFLVNFRDSALVIPGSEAKLSTSGFAADA